MNTSYEVYQIQTHKFCFSNYCYIILDKATNTAAIIDPAWELTKIINMLDNLRTYLEIIMLTHSHYDHVNLVKPLIKKYNTAVYMSKKEIDYYRFKCRNLHELNDMDNISIGETEISCLLTPGHTAGGMCYLLTDSLFTGDTIFIEGCGICTFRGGSAEQMFESIQRIKSVVPLYVRVYPGHSYGKSPGHALDYLMTENIYFQIERQYFLNFRMRKG